MKFILMIAVGIQAKAVAGIARTLGLLFRK